MSVWRVLLIPQPPPVVNQVAVRLPAHMVAWIKYGSEKCWNGKKDYTAGQQ